MSEELLKPEELFIINEYFKYNSNRSFVLYLMATYLRKLKEARFT